MTSRPTIVTVSGVMAGALALVLAGCSSSGSSDSSASPSASDSATASPSDAACTQIDPNTKLVAVSPPGCAITQEPTSGKLYSFTVDGTLRKIEATGEGDCEITKSETSGKGGQGFDRKLKAGESYTPTETENGVVGNQDAEGTILGVTSVTDVDCTAYFTFSGSSASPSAS